MWHFVRPWRWRSYIPSPCIGIAPRSAAHSVRGCMRGWVWATQVGFSQQVGGAARWQQGRRCVGAGVWVWVCAFRGFGLWVPGSHGRARQVHQGPRDSRGRRCGGWLVNEPQMSLNTRAAERHLISQHIRTTPPNHTHLVCHDVPAHLLAGRIGSQGEERRAGEAGDGGGGDPSSKHLQRSELV